MGVCCWTVMRWAKAMTHAWADRSRILLMTRTRQRLKNYGYEASDPESKGQKLLQQALVYPDPGKG